MRTVAAEATALSEEIDSPEARALAASARRRAYWGPAYLEQRLSDSTELLTLARASDDLELQLQGHAWLVLDLLEQGFMGAVDAQIEAFTALAEQLRQPLYLWNAAVWRAMRALLAGRLDDADRLATEALATGSHDETVTAPQYYAGQLLAIRREQGRMGELEAAARAMVATNPSRPTWRVALASLLAETGRREEAQGELDTLAARGFRDIPEDGDWLTAATLLADCCADLGDRGHAAQLYELLMPYREVNIVIGLAAVCTGSAARYLGRLAAVVGRRDEATEHFERALRANAAIKAPLWLAHTQLDYAHTLGKGRRATELIDAAAQTAEDLGLPRLARRVGELRPT
jgi:tetratricopeptide (TPR) repeat protein